MNTVNLKKNLKRILAGIAIAGQVIVSSIAPVIAHANVVNPDGSILISETNVVNSGSGTRSWRVLTKETVAQLTFIQGKGG